MSLSFIPFSHWHSYVSLLPKWYVYVYDSVHIWGVLGCLQAPSTDVAVSELTHASAEVSEIVFFLLGAMTIVEIVDAHQGFKLVTDNITTRKPRTLLWVVSVLFCIWFSLQKTFLLSILVFLIYLTKLVKILYALLVVIGWYLQAILLAKRCNHIVWDHIQ